MLARIHGVEAGAVPTVFVGGRVFVGDSPEIRRAIGTTVAAALARAPPPAAAAPHERPRPRETLELPLLGAVDVGARTLLVTTLIIAFVDGLDPRSLWVLILLLALVIRSGSRGRVATAGADDRHLGYAPGLRRRPRRRRRRRPASLVIGGRPVGGSR